MTFSIQITLNQKQRELLDAMVVVGIYGGSVEEIALRAVDERLIEIFAPYTQRKAGGAKS